MSTQHRTHDNHTHTHGAGCGHVAIRHDGHLDYLHDGHLHHDHDGHVDEHAVAVNASNPEACTNGHTCSGHDSSHRHDANCGHPGVPHGEHTDYLVDGHLHHQHNGHCDHHGAIAVA